MKRSKMRQPDSLHLPAGPDDQLEISGPELSDLPNKPVRIDGEGDIQVPLVGRIHVAGLTVQQTEQESTAFEQVHS